jgi:hypothetical protein
VGVGVEVVMALEILAVWVLLEAEMAVVVRQFPAFQH